MQTHPAELLEKFRTYNSPSISNAIEMFNVRGRDEGFMDHTVKCVFPHMPPFTGYAVTAKIRAKTPPGPGVPTVEDHYKAILSIPAPRVIVVEDLDDPSCVGSLWGEVNGNVHKALGCVAVVTNGGVRDLDEVEGIGLPLFAREVIVSHAYVHLVEVGTPVTVGGLTVRPGDLLHGDKHGVINIPHDIAARIPEAVDAIEAYERVIINTCKSPDFTVEKLLAARNGPRPKLQNY